MSAYSNNTFEQTFNLLCNNKIGYGMSRVVFDSVLLPDSVIKIEEGARMFQNAFEWETWRSAMGTPAEAWLARCEWISADGTVLIMEKTRPAAPSEYPLLVPDYLSDFKETNFGMVPTRITKGKKKGQPGPDRFVCHDYGTNLGIERGIERAKLRKPNFWRVGDK